MSTKATILVLLKERRRQLRGKSLGQRVASLASTSLAAALAPPAPPAPPLITTPRVHEVSVQEASFGSIQQHDLSIQREAEYLARLFAVSQARSLIV